MPKLSDDGDTDVMIFSQEASVNRQFLTKNRLHKVRYYVRFYLGLLYIISNFVAIIFKCLLFIGTHFTLNLTCTADTLSRCGWKTLVTKKNDAPLANKLKIMQRGRQHPMPCNLLARHVNYMAS